MQKNNHNDVKFKDEENSNSELENSSTKKNYKLLPDIISKHERRLSSKSKLNSDDDGSEKQIHIKPKKKWVSPNSLSSCDSIPNDFAKLNTLSSLHFTNDIIEVDYADLKYMPSILFNSNLILPLSSEDFKRKSGETHINGIRICNFIALVMIALRVKHDIELNHPILQSFIQKEPIHDDETMKMAIWVFENQYDKMLVQQFLKDLSTDRLFGILLYLLKSFKEPPLALSEKTFFKLCKINIGPQYYLSTNEMINNIYDRAVMFSSAFHVILDPKIDNIVPRRKTTLRPRNLPRRSSSSQMRSKATNRGRSLFFPVKPSVSTRTSNDLLNQHPFMIHDLVQDYFNRVPIKLEDKVKQENMVRTSLHSEIKNIPNHARRRLLRYVIRNMIYLCRRFIYISAAVDRKSLNMTVDIAKSRIFPRLTVETNRSIARHLGPCMVKIPDSLAHFNVFKTEQMQQQVMENILSNDLDRLWFSQQNSENMITKIEKAVCHSGCNCGKTKQDIFHNSRKY